jgi:hypothetical protein
MATHTTSRGEDDRRIRSTTRWLVGGAVAATAVFGGLAAAHTHEATSGNSTSVSDVSNEDDDGFLPSTSAPQQSSSPPVAQSGGS